MELREWKFMNQPAGSATSNTGSGSAQAASSTFYRDKFKKLLYYHVSKSLKPGGFHRVLNHKVDTLMEDATKAGFIYWEEYMDNSDGTVSEFSINVWYYKTTKAWTFKVLVDGREVANKSGSGFNDLINDLSARLATPLKGSREYQDLLEWKSMNPPAQQTSSAYSGYKKRFEKLIKYHIDHASSELESITRKDIKDDGFHLGEHYNTGKSEFDREIKVSYSIKNNTFIFSIRIDNILVENKTVDSYEKLVERLESYMFLPDEGTSEYDDLLVEWVVMNNSTTSSSQPASVASSKTNKEKFTELVAYMQKHKDSSVIFTSVNGPNDNGFEYEEQKAFTNGDEYNMSLEVECKSGNLFFIHLDMDGKRIATKHAVGWEDLLLKIKTHFHVPKMGSPEYKSLTESFSSELNEWKLMNPPTQQAQAPTSSTKGGYWERFNRLLFYHVNHKSPAVDKVVRTKVSKDGFHYTEHIRAGTTGYDRDVVVNIDLAATENWKLQTYIDGKPHVGGAGYGYVNLLKELRKHLNLPVAGTPEYTKLLTEDFSSELREWKLMNPPQPTTSKNPYTRGQAYRYNRLLDQITSDGIAKYKLHKITNITLDITLDTKKTKNLNIKITYDPADDSYTMVTNGSSTLEGCDYEKDILPLLQAGGVIANTNLCESAGSIADDFKLYENLWD